MYDNDNNDERSMIVLVLACIVLVMIYLVPIIVGISLYFSTPLQLLHN